MKIYLSMVIFILFIADSAVARNQAAQKAAWRLYEESYQKILAKQWEEAVGRLEVALLLKPDFEAAVLRREKIKRFLKKKEEPVEILGVGEKPDWKRVEMERVKKYLEEGRRREAVLSLQEILYQDPHNERARLFLEKLKAKPAGEEKDPLISEALSAKFQKAKELLLEGTRAKSTITAYQKLKRGVDLFQEKELKPPFYQPLREALSKREALLSVAIDKKLSKLEKEMAQKDADLRKIGLVLKSFPTQYPPHPKTAALSQEVYEKLREKTTPLLSQAKTLYELNGCAAAVDSFRAVQKRSAFPEVSSWQEASRYLKVCKEILP